MRACTCLHTVLQLTPLNKARLVLGCISFHSAMPSPALCDSVFREKLRGLASKGCPYCKHPCFALLAPEVSSILEYRRDFFSASTAVQNRDLLWIFGGGAAIPDDAGPPPTEMGHESTSCSSSEAIAAPASTAREAPASPAEKTSESEEDGQPGGLPQHAPTEVTSESAAEVTSHSSEAEPLVDDAFLRKRRACPKNRSYKRRRSTRNHLPSILVQGVLCSSPIKVCLKAAQHCIGVSSQRVKRQLDGMPDRRTRAYGGSITSTQRACPTDSALTAGMLPRSPSAPRTIEVALRYEIAMQATDREA